MGGIQSSNIPISIETNKTPEPETKCKSLVSVNIMTST